MSIIEFDSLLEEFNRQANYTQIQLTNLMTTISEKKAPTRKDVDCLDAHLEKLRKSYDDFVVAAKEKVLLEELPAEGSSLDAYSFAVENSMTNLLRKKIEEAGILLRRFIAVRAKLTEYATVLKPFQDTAHEFLGQFSDVVTEEDLQMATEGPEAFLQAMDLKNINSPEGFSLLERISKHYPIQVQWGLVGHQYYEETSGTDEQNTEKDDSTTAFVAEPCSEEQKSENEIDESVDKNQTPKEEQPPANHTDDLEPELIVSSEAPEDDTSSVCEEKQTQATSTVEVTAIDNSGSSTSILHPINKVKTGDPSASSFKKEIVKIGRIHPIIRVLLPMLTNIGVMTQRQAYLFGVCLDSFPENDISENSVDLSLKALVSKGYLAAYVFWDSGEKKTAYCLTDYCDSCLRKESVKSQMKGYWRLSYGKYRFVYSDALAEETLLDPLRMNDSLLSYLYAIKERISRKQYDDVCESIQFDNGCYRVAVIDGAETIICHLVSDRMNVQTFCEKNVLICMQNDVLLSSVDPTIESLYILCHGEIKKYVVSDGVPVFLNQLVYDLGSLSKNNDSPEKTDGEVDLATGFENRTIETEKSNVSMLSKADTASNGEFDTEKENESAHANEQSEEKNVEMHTLVDSKNKPTDEVFCTLIGQLIKQEAFTKDDLTSAIVHSVLLATGAGLENDRPMAKKLSAQLQLATHLLLENISYSSEDLTSAFTDPETENKPLLLSAYSFAMLTPAVAFDYSLINQSELFFADYDRYFDHLDAFKPLFNKLLTVHNVSSVGFSPAIISLLGSDEESQAFLNGLRVEARNHLTVQFPTTRMKALPQLYSKCFGNGSDLYECMRLIAEGKNDEDGLAFVETVLEEYCTKQDDVFTLNQNKVEDRLNAEWNMFYSDKNFKLEYGARDHALKNFTSRIELMRIWFEQANVLTKKQQDISRLCVLKQELLELIEETGKDSSWKTDDFAIVLSWMLIYMRAYLSGEINRIKIFKELLQTGIIPMHDDGSPVIDPTMTMIRYYEPWRNALRHILATKRPLGEVKAEILGDTINTEDDAGLKDNLHQLYMIGKLLESSDDEYIITELQKKEAADSADERTVKFQEALELAYTYNQINELEKETLAGIMSQYKNSFYESSDFANWRRFIEALEKQIKECAADKKVGLRSRLDQQLAENPNSVLLKEADKLLEEYENFAVAEEYINRFDSGETDLDDNLGMLLLSSNYFEDFLSGDRFDRLLQVCRQNNGRALKAFAWNYLEKHLPKDWTNRNREDSKTMIMNWPFGKGVTSAEQIKTLFSCIGFKVIKASKINGRKQEMFQLAVKPTPKSMADYTHPIASFGTQLKSPLNVIILYGNYTEKQIVDTISSLDLGGISVVLIDRPIDIAGRRLIGEIFHTQTSGQNPFLLVDQVLIMYLAMHQVTERLPALLMCTLPFTTYQPFVRDGGSTTDEMFCGRSQELATIKDPNGACVVYGGRQLGKTALLERVESLCSKPENKAFAVFSSIIRITDESDVVATLISDIEKKTGGSIKLKHCDTLKEMCNQLSEMFRSSKIVSMHLLIDEVDDFLAAISDQAYAPLQPLVDLKRETTNNFKFVIAGLHNVCRAKNATRENGIFGQLGTPLCIKPLSPTDALNLLSRPLNYLGFQISRYPHMETILTNTNYYPGILQFFGYMLVQTLSGQYSKYYHAASGNPPFTLQDEQLGSVMNSSDLNKSIKDKFRWSLELDSRYFMIARCITMLYHLYADDCLRESWLGFRVEEIMDVARAYGIHCLANETREGYKNLLDEMEEMGILSQPESGSYRLRRNSFVDIIGEDIDALEEEIKSSNKEA